MNKEFLAELEAKNAERLPMSLTAEEVAELHKELTASAESTAEAEAEAAEVTTEPKGKLPDDFPARATLADAGINTFTQLRKQRDSEEGLTGVPGVGDATAAKIEEAMKE